MKHYGITRVANVTGLDWLGVPVVMVCRPNSRSLSVSQGKGLTLDAAKASGLMEAIELYHAEHIMLPVQTGSVCEMSKRYPIIDLDRLPYVDRLQYNPHRQLTWIEGHDLLHDQAVWVPYECVTTDTVHSHLPGQACFGITSNGLASGNNILEAIVHGICEVVERDAMTLWNRRGVHERRLTWVDIDRQREGKEENVRRLVSRFSESGLQTLVWDITSDIGISSFLCLLYEASADDSRLPYTSSGMGCHLSPEIALTRAMTEAAQSRLTLIAGSRDDMFRHHYGSERFRPSSLMQYISLRPTYRARTSGSDRASLDGDTFNADLELILNKLRVIGIKQVIVVALTEPHLPYQVVKVIIPGLEAIDDHPLYSAGPRVQRLLQRFQ